MKRICAIIFALLLVVSACARNELQVADVSADGADAFDDFNAVLEAARGTTVTFYGWGGSAATNAWLDNVVGATLLEEYGVKLRRIPMDIDDILSKLMSEKQAGVQSGDIDVVWINGENFYTAKNADLLFGPITQYIENYAVYLDPDNADLHYDFGTPIEGMEVPYGKAQLVFIGDTAVLDSFPSGAQELLELAKQNPGKITYPAPPDFTGSAFVRNILYEIVGFDAIFNAPDDENALYEVIKPGLDFLNEMKPYLWQEGKTYPSTAPAVEQMFADGLLLMNISYTPLRAAQKILSGEYPITAQTFLFEKGNIGNTHYIAIPKNAPNKSGALTLIHHIISAEMQITKYDASNWGDLPVFDVGRLNAQQSALLDGIDNGVGILTPDELFAHRMPEVQASKVPVIERLWERYVLSAG
ncbi:MAG: ABC transporter substrate-binding protein [Oscillospiraceae bacterium]|jgi:putative spermidine/putrescine transport system substrate-binding protein|nr:ABC transporter substrate-binding protein [Oscillospiraceae bacterium]